MPNKKTKKKEPRKIPKMPSSKEDGVISVLIWYIRYNYLQVIGILLIAIIGATFKCAVSKDPETGKYRIDYFEIDPIDVDVNVGEEKK